ncbi:MAG: DUF3127 domain-containing protein [Prevotella sp.]|nr:DUF3127 domain-containing protein [Prevotella sp.]
MKYEFTGTVTEVFPTQTFGSKGFQKREFRVKEKSDSQYPNIVPFVLIKDKCSFADSLTEGAEVTVHFSLSGRIWSKDDQSPTRCFCENQCWKIDILQKGKPNVPSVPEPSDEDESVVDDDLPF